MTEQAQREHFTNFLVVITLAAVLVSVAAWGWPEVRAGWRASASARAILVGQP